MPAGAVVNAPPGTGEALISGRVVIIANTHGESGDIHRTPIGFMPGAMIIANTTWSLMRPLPLQESTIISETFVMLLLLLATILIMEFSRKWRSRWLNPVIVKNLIGLFLSLICFWVGWLLLPRGEWIDFAIPLYFITVYFLAVEVREMQQAWFDAKNSQVGNQQLEKIAAEESKSGGNVAKPVASINGESL